MGGCLQVSVNGHAKVTPSCGPRGCLLFSPSRKPPALSPHSEYHVLKARVLQALCCSRLLSRAFEKPEVRSRRLSCYRKQNTAKEYSHLTVFLLVSSWVLMHPAWRESLALHHRWRPTTQGVLDMRGKGRLSIWDLQMLAERAAMPELMIVSERDADGGCLGEEEMEVFSRPHPQADTGY